jgi:membrane-associated HD superfamily phosphohydrolase
MFGVYIIRKSNDMYMEINDVEFPLLVSLKEKDKDEFFRAVHTGYLAEKVAGCLGLDERAVKTCAYYHRIGVLDGATKWGDMEHYFLDNKFPDDAVELLHEYSEPTKGSLRTKEVLTVQLSETVIASIMSLLKENKDANIDYEKLIDDLLDKKEQSGELKDYEVTYNEYFTIRKLIKKEKLYYDFLR